MPAPWRWQIEELEERKIRSILPVSWPLRAGVTYPLTMRTGCVAGVARLNTLVNLTETRKTFAIPVWPVMMVFRSMFVEV
jgi:hypothetical protein